MSAERSEEELLSVRRVAEDLSASESWVRKMIRTGKMGCLREGVYVRVSRAQLAAFRQRIRREETPSTTHASPGPPPRRTPAAAAVPSAGGRCAAGTAARRCSRQP